MLACMCSFVSAIAIFYSIVLPARNGELMGGNAGQEAKVLVMNGISLGCSFSALHCLAKWFRLRSCNSWASYQKWTALSYLGQTTSKFPYLFSSSSHLCLWELLLSRKAPPNYTYTTLLYECNSECYIMTVLRFINTTQEEQLLNYY